MSKSTISVPNDKCLLDVLAEMGEEIISIVDYTVINLLIITFKLIYVL